MYFSITEVKFSWNRYKKKKAAAQAINFCLKQNLICIAAIKAYRHLNPRSQGNTYYNVSQALRSVPLCMPKSAQV